MKNKEIWLFKDDVKQRVSNPKRVRFWTKLIDADKLMRCSYEVIK